MIGRTVVLASIVALAASGTRAEEPAAPAPPQSTPDKWGFSGRLGVGGAGGDYGNLFTKPISWEFDLFRQRGPWRYGLGLGFGSFKMKEPYQDELEWGMFQGHLFGTRMLRTQGAVRPYLQLRGGVARLHPRSLLFETIPPPEDFQAGQSPTKAADGFSVAVVPGLELRLSRAASLDVSFPLTYFSTDKYDLTPVNQPSYGSGTSWEARLGATWFPNGGEGDSGGARDAWGVRKSYGWAIGEMLAINNVAEVASEYVRKVDWSQTSPRSWWANIKGGYTYDSDKFKTNQWTHPFNGAAYYNSGRANGLSFWPSSAIAVSGAALWECCGESQAMSFNDLIATGIGGIALGEAQYRLSSEILNNQSTGMGRFWRELGGFVVDPVRGFDRIVSGRVTRVADNPEDPMDWRPGGATFLATGVRVIGEGSSISENTKTYATILLSHSYGNVFDSDRRKPFDYMDVTAALDFGDKVALDNVQLRGNLASWPLGSNAQPNHVFALVQHFDYMNNNAYVFGGQSLGAALMSRFRLSDKASVTTRLDADAIVLGAVNADYSWLADTTGDEQLRDYDYGPGAGGMATATLAVSGHPLLTALYRFAWISVTNGSVYNKGNFGSDANHYLQGGGVRLFVPLKGGLGLGADAYLFLRNSHYELVNAAEGIDRRKNLSQRNPQARIYLALSSPK